jgi:hypothetical protein
MEVYSQSINKFTLDFMKGFWVNGKGSKKDFSLVLKLFLTRKGENG